MVQFSLGTSDRTKAAKLREIQDVKWSACFAEAESPNFSCNANADLATIPTLKALSPSQAMRIAWDYFVKSDSKREADYKKDGPASEEEREEIKQNLKLSLYSSQSIDDPNGWQSAYETARKLSIEKKVVSADPDDVDQGLVSLLRRATAELAKRGLSRLEGGYAETYDPLFDPTKPPSETVRELAKSLSRN